MSFAVVQTLFSFKARLPRAPFWWSSVATWTSFSVLFVFLAGSLGRPFTWILYPPLLWIVTALLVKRLHDHGSSAWSLLWILLPVFGPLWLFLSLGFRKGTEGDNQYGQDPLLVDVNYLRVDTP